MGSAKDKHQSPTGLLKLDFRVVIEAVNHDWVYNRALRRLILPMSHKKDARLIWVKVTHSLFPNISFTIRATRVVHISAISL